MLSLFCTLFFCYKFFTKHRHGLNKVLVHESIFDDIFNRLQQRFEKLRVGINLDKCNDYGPFITKFEAKNFKEKLSSTLKFANIVQFYDCIKDKSVENLQEPVIITDLETNTEFYQQDVSYLSVGTHIFLSWCNLRSTDPMSSLCLFEQSKNRLT